MQQTLFNLNDYGSLQNTLGHSEFSIVQLLRSPDLQIWERNFLMALIYRQQTRAEAIVIRAIAEKVNPSDLAAG